MVEATRLTSGGDADAALRPEMDSFESIARASFLVLPANSQEANRRLDERERLRRKNARLKRSTARRSIASRGRPSRDSTNNSSDSGGSSNDSNSDDYEGFATKRRPNTRRSARQPINLMQASHHTVYPLATDVNTRSVLRNVDPDADARLIAWKTANNHRHFVPLLDGKEDNALVTLRELLLQKNWNKISQWYEDMSLRLNASAFQSIHKYISNAYNGFDHRSSMRSDAPPRLGNTEIPTCAIFSGVNLADIANLFLKFVDMLAVDKKHATAMVPSYSNLTLKHCARLIISQILETPFVELETDPNEDTATGNRMAPYDFSVIESWYKRSNLKGNIVLFFPEFESFDSDLMRELLSIFANYIDTLPIVLVFGVATSMDALYQTFSRIQMKHLCIEKFWLQHSNTLLNSLFEEMIISPDGPLCLGIEPYELLLHRFQLYNYSTDSFMMSLQYSCIDKYYSNPLSFLYDEFIHNENPEILNALTEDHFEEIRMCSSFKRYVDDLMTRDQEQVAGLLFSQEPVRNLLVTSLIDVYRYRHRMHCILRLILAIQEVLNSPSFTRGSRTFYFSMLSGRILDGNYISTMFDLLRKRPTRDFLHFMETIIGIVDESLTQCSSKEAYFSEQLKENPTETIGSLIDFYTTTKLWLQKAYDTMRNAVDANSNAANSQVKGNEDDDNLLARKIEGDRHTKTTNSSNPIDAVMEAKGHILETVVGIVAYLQDIVAEHLYSYMDNSLYELVYYSNGSRIQKSFHPRLRASIQTALENTKHYINAAPETTADNSGTTIIYRELPDVAICYRLYLEGSKVINVYDWFVAFSTIVSAGKVDVASDVVSFRLKEQENMSKKGNAELEEATVSTELRLLQARFIRAIAELQFIGFIKPQNKMDFVSRLTWGRM